MASEDEIRKGLTTDVYFVRTKRILEAKGLGKSRAFAEVTAGSLPCDWPWGVLAGVEDVAKLLEGLPVDVYCMAEGSLFYSRDINGVREPVLAIEGPYAEYCEFETPLLGLLCQASGICTASARMRKRAGDKMLVSFGIRRMHPAIAPMIDRNAYIGGFDGISCVLAAEIMGRSPSGTMPHSLIIMFGDQVKAWKAYDEVIEPEALRIALADTYQDEKFEALMAAEALGERLYGIRLDTPSSRKGNFLEIIREVRWELNTRGYDHVRIFVSGGIKEENINELIGAGVDGFGIGTSISNSPTVDFALDIVEREGKLVAKRGKLGGRKQVWRCSKCMVDVVKLVDVPAPKCPKCGGKMIKMLKPLVRKGKIVAELPNVDEIRSYVAEQLKKISLQ